VRRNTLCVIFTSTTVGLLLLTFALPLEMRVLTAVAAIIIAVPTIGAAIYALRNFCCPKCGMWFAFGRAAMHIPHYCENCGTDITKWDREHNDADKK
jgi:hypothetical protein